MPINVAAERAYPTPVANSSLLPLLLLSLAHQKNAPFTSSVLYQEYDYVIVGAGTAGSVVASRLSEMECVTILLLEAGKTPPLLTDVPGYTNAFWGSDIDWNYKTTPQKHTFKAFKNNSFYIPRGKVLGGSSTINAMLYVRGNEKDFDGWASKGAKGWSFKEVYKYFIKMENNLDPAYFKNGYHGTGGPLSVKRPPYAAEAKNPVIESLKLLGYKVVDINGKANIGTYDLQATQRNALRCSASKAYLVPAENRTNLHIVTNAFVEKIIIEQGRAKGVFVDYKDRKYQILAKREVILSAGALNSPQILMLSGIGPKEQLKGLNIPLMMDLPVGKNLQDHCEAPIFVELSSKIRTFDEKISDNNNIKKFIQNRTGPLSSTTGTSVLAFLNSQDNKSLLDLLNSKGDKSLLGLLNSEGHESVLDLINSKGNQLVLDLLKSLSDKSLLDLLNSQDNKSLLDLLNSKDDKSLLGLLNSEDDKSLLDLLSSKGGKNNDFPDLQLLFHEPPSADYVKPILKDEFYKSVFGPIKGKTLFGCESIPLQPKSRGTVTLQSNNPYDTPLVDPNYLANKEDVQVMITGMLTCLKVLFTPSVVLQLGVKLPITFYPGCKNLLYVLSLNELFECMLRYLIIPGHHFVGTARMGDPNNKTTVVDPQLRVIGIEGLRVVDASVMPTITSGNVMVPIYMIAEKASDIIKQTIKCDTKPIQGPVGRKPHGRNCK